MNSEPTKLWDILIRRYSGIRYLDQVLGFLRLGLEADDDSDVA